LSSTYAGAGASSLTSKLQAENGYNYGAATMAGRGNQQSPSRATMSPSRINIANRYSKSSQYGSVTPQPTYDRYGGAEGTTQT